MGIPYATSVDAIIRDLTEADYAEGMTCGPLDLAKLNGFLKEVVEREGNNLAGGSFDAATSTLTLTMTEGTQITVDLSAPSGIPSGIITMWTGTVPPAGWAICNGQNGTPDLRGRFIVGGDGTFPMNTTGGNANHTHGGAAADVALTVDQMPAHRHANGVVDSGSALFNHGSLVANPSLGSSIDGNGSSGSREGYTTTDGGGLPHSHPLTIDSASNIPPYYALAYIMKL